MTQARKLRFLAAGLLVTIAAMAQIGAPAKLVSPEIVEMMKRESRQTFTTAESREFKKLHDADAAGTRATEEIRQRVIFLSNQFTELELLVSGLDTTVDTRRLLMRNTTDILELQRVQKASEEDRKISNERQWAILVGIILLFVGAAVRWLFEARAASTRDATLIAQVIAHLDSQSLKR